VIEVGHPTPLDGQLDPRVKGEPFVHVGPVAAGKAVALDDQLRQELAARSGILAFDTELDAVVESIYGNRKDQYTLIRGMADYKDGSRRKEWQQYAALMAAGVLKSVVEEMP
jgi:nucleoside phosphorylase